jgi:hypothetical protein
MIPTGKQAMVWKLRNWCGGVPLAQVAEAKRLGLARVSIKVTDGRVEKWEGGSRTNKDLLPATVLALQSAGIEVDGWAWMKGYATQWDWSRSRFVRCTPADEARAAVDVCHRLHMEHLQADAESDYRRRAAWAAEWCAAANGAGPDLFLSLCSYRFPLSNQPDFPIRTFAPSMDGWSPQVYWLGDNRIKGGAIQLEYSAQEHARVRLLPFIGVAPTYQAAGPWRATPGQLAAFFARAVQLGHAGVSIWALDLATEGQKQALADFTWGSTSTPGTDLWRLLQASNLRTGPGVSFPVIRLLSGGTVIDRLDFGGGVGGDWWRVGAGNDVGWMWTPSYKVSQVA